VKKLKQNNKQIIYLILAMIFILTCNDPLTFQSPGDPPQIQALNANYTNGRVELQWAPVVSPDISYFELYRTTKLDSNGNVDTASMSAIDARARIEPNASSFSDIPGPQLGTYYYSILGVKLVPNGLGFDTIRGPLSEPFVPVKIGHYVRFTINNDETQTSVKNCKLYVYDRDLVLESVRFSQVAARDTGPVVNCGGSTNPGALGEGQITSMEKAQFIYDKYAVTAEEPTIPWFDSVASCNIPAPVMYAMGTDTLKVFDWELSDGSGKKRVFAELTYKPGYDISKDTITEIIYTKPIKMEVILRNDPEQTFDTSVEAFTEWTRYKYINADELQFSVKIFGDTTVNREFEYWLMWTEFNSLMSHKTFKARTYRWFMTTPMKAQLTNENSALHNPDKLYSVPLSRKKSEWQSVFDTLISGQEKTVDSIIDGTMSQARLDSNEVSFSSLRSDNLKFGYKGFLFVTRFRESGFNDEILLVHGYTESDTFYTVRDIYPPVMKFDHRTANNPDDIAEGDTLANRFNFALADSNSLIDKGFATIENVELVIAQKPDWLTNPDDENARSLLTIDSLLAYPNRVFGYVIEKPYDTLHYVRWDNIDPQNWATGDYLFGVVTLDEFGNRGFALTENSDKNPFLVHIKTTN